MINKGLKGGQYRPLSDRDILAIHSSAIEVLERTGLSYEAGLEDTLEMLERAGAIVSRETARIRFPRDLVVEQVAKAPKRVVLCGRDPRHDLELEGDRVYLGNGGAAIRVLDLETGQARPSRLDDLYQIARLMDRLENIHFCLRPCVPLDIPEEVRDLSFFYSFLTSTTKHVMGGVNGLPEFRDVLAMASLLAGGLEAFQQRPFLSLITCFCISPLKLETTATHIMQEAARNRIPTALSGAPMAGSTAPLPMAGLLTQLHAEQLAGITICQVTNPGAPVLYGGAPALANLRTMGYRGGAVECGMMNAAIHQLAAHIKIPNYNSAALSDSKIPDAQAGWEKATTILLAVMGGSNYIHHAAGMLESMLAVAYEQYVIDDEIIGMATKVLKGIDVDPDRLSLGEIDAVGPGGTYMTAPSTMCHLRTEYFEGNGVSDTGSRDKWEKDGCLDARERARRIARRILNQAPKSYIPQDMDRKIRSRFPVVDEAEARALAAGGGS